MDAETAPSPVILGIGVAVIAGGIFLIWYACRPALAAAEKVVETVAETVAP